MRRYLPIFSGLLAVLWWPGVGWSQAPQREPRCFSGQYILRTSPVAMLESRAVEDFHRVTSGSTTIAAENRGMILVAPAQEVVQGALQNSRVLPKEIADNPCRALKRQQRSKLRSLRAAGIHGLAGGGQVVRPVECDCNGLLQADQTPADPYYNLLWGMDLIGAPQAWNLSTGSSDVVVAVIDTGVAYNHPDLAANIWTNPNEIAGNGVDDDGNGYIDDVHGINAILGAPYPGDPNDDHYHGTHVSGTIGGIGNNSEGVAGVNWNVKIMGVKFLSSSGSGSLYDAVVALRYVNDMKQRGVNIVTTSNSWGGGGYFQLMYDEIARSRDLGLLFIAAAGNAANNNDTNPFYPCSYQVDNVISVAALDTNDTLAYFSNYGANSVHIAAPGVNVWSSIPYLYNGVLYKYLSGTSMATPHVSGAAALLKAFRPDLNWTQIRDALFQGRVNPALSGKVIGNRDLYLPSAMNSVAGPTPTPTATPTRTPTPTPTATPAPGYRSVQGVITNYNVAVSGLLVTLTLPDGTNLTAITDASGRFVFAQVWGPVYGASLSWSKTGYGTGSIPVLDITQDLNLSLAVTPQNYLTEMLVLDSQKKPLGGALITIPNTASAYTGGDGKAYFSLPYAASYQISAAKDGYTFASRSHKVLGPSRRLFVSR